MSDRNAHIYPLPDGRWATMWLTDQEAFDYEHEHFGAEVALANWQEIHAWRQAGRPPSLRVEDGQEG